MESTCSRIDIEIHVLDPKPYWFDSHSRHRSVKGRLSVFPCSHGQYTVLVEYVDSTGEQQCTVHSHVQYYTVHSHVQYYTVHTGRRSGIEGGIRAVENCYVT